MSEKDLIELVAQMVFSLIHAGNANRESSKIAAIKAAKIVDKHGMNGANFLRGVSDRMEEFNKEQLKN